MSTRNATERFDKQPIGALVEGRTLFMAVFFGGFVGVIALVTTSPTTAVAVVLAIGALVYGLAYYGNASTAVYATPDALVREFDGVWSSETQIPFESVDVVVRKSPTADSLLGTGTYEVVRTGGESEPVKFLSDPERFERVVDERVEDPPRQYRDADRHSHHFWYLWPADHEDELPATPVVDEDELASTLDVDLSEVDLGGLDDAVETTSINDFGDVQTAIESSGDAGDFDAGGGGGGDVGGGGGAE